MLSLTWYPGLQAQVELTQSEFVMESLQFEVTVQFESPIRYGVHSVLLLLT